MRHHDNSTERLWLVFSISSALFLVVLAIAPLKDYFQEYKDFQKQYRELLLDQASSRKELDKVRDFEVSVRQIWAPELDGTVDRCISCHTGLEDPGMEAEKQPLSTHPPTPHVPRDVGKFGCVVCHRGQGRALTTEEAHGQTEDWERPLLPIRYVEASCGTCHLDDNVGEASMLSEGRRLIRQYRCYGCHDFPGSLDESTAPNLDGLSRKTTVDWLRRWLQDPVSLQPQTRMPRFRLNGDELEAILAFLWTRDPLAEITVSDEALSDGDYDAGRKIFRESRCISCHLVEGKGNGSAPELAGLGSKVGRNWLASFLRNPHAFQPETEMPRYNFTAPQIGDLVTYMKEEFVDFSFEEEGSSTQFSARQIEQGEGLFRSYGCSGCHKVSGLRSQSKVGPNLTGIGDKPVQQLDFGLRDDLQRTLPDWLEAKVSDPGSFRENLKMPEFTLTGQEKQALVTALLAMVKVPVPKSFSVEKVHSSYEPPGRFGRLVERYRCLSCHQIEGVGGDISKAELTAEGSKVNREWLKQYLLVPATIRPLLTDRMIPLKMSEDEAGFLAEFMSNVYVDNRIPERVFDPRPPAEAIERGRRLYFEVYGCQSCHMLENKGGYYGPLLDGFGERLKEGWISWWLQHPQRWRADVRCPNFGIDETDANDLTAFLITASHN